MVAAGPARTQEFTIDGKPTFLLGISYYGALGASRETIRHDLDDMQKYGFNWIRVWATWAAFENNVTVVDAEGKARAPHFSMAAMRDVICEWSVLWIKIMSKSKSKSKKTGNTPHKWAALVVRSRNMRASCTLER